MPKEKKPKPEDVVAVSSDITETAAQEGLTTIMYVATEIECNVDSICIRPDGGRHWCVWTQVPGEKLHLHKANFTHLGEWFFIIKQDNETVKYLKVTVQP